MAIKLARFNAIPDGWHKFRIESVTHDENFGTVEINLTTKDGYTHTEKYRLLTKTGAPNEGALKAFSYFVAVTLNEWTLKEVDENELVGKFIKAEIKRTPSTTINKQTGEPFININLGDKKHCTGWDDEDDDDGDDEVTADDLYDMLN